MDYLELIPEEVVRDILMPFIPLRVFFLTSKIYYEKYFPQFIAKISLSLKLDTFARRQVRYKNAYMFNLLIIHKYNAWFKIKKFCYKTKKTGTVRAATYIDFLKLLCNEYQSNACKNKIIEYEKKIGKKTPKKIKYKNIRWSN